MSRPAKNNADYFSHDASMRNDRKIKALRVKFGLEGYAVWNMLLETITDVENFEIEINDVEYELIAGDFGIDVDRLRAIIDYLVTIDLVSLDNDILHCPNLTKRLMPVIEKRKRDADYRDRRKKADGRKNRVNDVGKTKETGVTDNDNLISEDVSDVVNPQSKVKESKVKENEIPPYNPPAKFDVEHIGLPDCISRGDWSRWVAYLRNKGKPLVEESAHAQIRQLTQWHAKGHDTADVIEKSIASGWISLVEPKAQEGGICLEKYRKAQ